jgi:photosystem II stability/assembly factor-like uncharacterized protein
MRFVLLLFAATAALAQSNAQIQVSHTTESLRGASAVSRQVAWASGTHGTYLRTIDAGKTWTASQLPGAGVLDFRAVVAFSADEAFLMSAGSGDQSRIYHTADGGQHWQLQFTNSNPKGFFDSMVFWDRTHGVVLGDPIVDENGKLEFDLLLTTDGQTWMPLPASQLPPAEHGESAFAASNSCLAILKDGASKDRAPKDGASKGGASFPDSNIWFVTGGRVARVFHSPDRGRSWEVFDTPITHGPDSAGIFSVAFRDATHGVIVGGDYKHPDHDGDNLAFTSDGGKTWNLPRIHPQAYFSAVAYDRQSADASRGPSTSSDNRDENEYSPRLFIVAPKFIFDFRPPHDPTRISPSRRSKTQFNAVSAYPDGGALFVGPNGSIAFVP